MMSTETMSLGSEVESLVRRRLAQWREDRVPERLWAKDPTLWSKQPVEDLADRLGWLSLPAAMKLQRGQLRDFADQVCDSGVTRIVLLGMGGSSLAPEIFQRIFGTAPGYPELMVLDTTHPDAVQAVIKILDLAKTLFVVSSKSGTTLETISLFKIFWKLCSEAVDEPGQRFVAITDPGSPLEALAKEHQFREVFGAPEDIGGRFSALSVYGLVPAALIGVDLGRLLGHAQSMAVSCADRESNPGLELGAALGELAMAGREKLTFVVSPTAAPFPNWLEQLIAESTGKLGLGLIPVSGEPLGTFDVYDDDRTFVHFWLVGEEDPEITEGLATLEKIGYPVIRIPLDSQYSIGREIMRWEVAVATAALVLGIHPFNQPDVKLSKELTRQAMEKEPSEDKPPITPLDDALSQVQLWLQDGRMGDYLSIQAFLPPEPAVIQQLARLQQALRDNSALATTVGFGPRYLHSTGQLHKGGPDTGLYLQLVDNPKAQTPVPDTDTDLGAIIAAQADGDLEALIQRERRVLRLVVEENLAELVDELVAILD
jgi:transaldolase/glucose-6-phosphate isomerase